MTKFEKIRAYFLAGLWSQRQLTDALAKHCITQEEFLLILKEKEERR